MTVHIPEYNPLHDSNLKTFYSNERNLKRLRENGEITNENEVICNLKDFNQYREDLHKSQLYYVLQAYRQREAERHDRMLIANAEGISRKDNLQSSIRHQSHDEVIARKQQLEQEKHERKVRIYNMTEEKFKKMENMLAMQQMLLEHRKMLTNMRIQAHISLHQDLQRKHLIKLKKLFQFKKDRYNKNMRNLFKQRVIKNAEGQIQSWHKRLNERIANQRRIDVLLSEVQQERAYFIESHKEKYREKWQNIQEQIKRRSHDNRQQKNSKGLKKKTKKKRVADTIKTVAPSFCDEYQASFEGLLDSELCYALNTAIELGGHTPLTFDTNDPIYKAAKYILNHILYGFNVDLSEDPCAMHVLSERIMNFLCDAKKYVNYVSCDNERYIGLVSSTNTPFHTPRKPYRLLALPMITRPWSCHQQMPNLVCLARIMHVSPMSRLVALLAPLVSVAMRYIRLWTCVLARNVDQHRRAH